MPEFIINDDWVLQRVTKESSSFSDWAKNLVATVSKALEEKRPEIAQDIEKAKHDLPDMVHMEESLKKAEKHIAGVQKKLDGLGSLGSYISNLTSNIHSSITDKVQKELSQSGIPDINIDFIKGKVSLQHYMM